MVLKDPPAVPVSGWLVPEPCGPGGSQEAPSLMGEGRGCLQRAVATNSSRRLQIASWPDSIFVLFQKSLFFQTLSKSVLIHQKRS